jgi:hypothetical protein
MTKKTLVESVETLRKKNEEYEQHRGKFGELLKTAEDRVAALEAELADERCAFDRANEIIGKYEIENAELRAVQNSGDTVTIPKLEYDRLCEESDQKESCIAKICDALGGDKEIAPWVRIATLRAELTRRITTGVDWDGPVLDDEDPEGADDF